MNLYFLLLSFKWNQLHDNIILCSHERFSIKVNLYNLKVAEMSNSSTFYKNSQKQLDAFKIQARAEKS